MGPSPKVSRNTILAGLVPGAGHLAMGQARIGAGLLLLQGSGVGLALWHLLWGINALETSLGSFCFAAILRNLPILHVFSIIDVYLKGVDPAGAWAHPRRRLAVLLNVMLPGLGYLPVRAWVRAGTGAVLTGLFLSMARAGNYPFLDLGFVVMQGIMGVMAYRQARIRESEEAGLKPGDPVLEAEAPAQAPAGQIAALIAGLAVACWCGWVLEQRLPSRVVANLQLSDIRVEQSDDGVRFSVPRLGLSMSAPGRGWQAVEDESGYLFAAAHPDRAMMRLGIQLIPAFMGEQRLVDRLRRMTEDRGYIHKKTLRLLLNGVPAVQMRFSGSSGADPEDFWAITVPRDRFTFVMYLNCTHPGCKKLAADLEGIRDSFKIPE